ncbi:unnamed protein product [Protopolystoma xenopodis]|uniref:Uncharacterized protein n=1 Tax=Protopolystoma xenopodis TaxID=117903 RepID=A0A448WH67_9PLAT|nr:unnamed protein product [Protopolystoma xenopodis]
MEPQLCTDSGAILGAASSFSRTGDIASPMLNPRSDFVNSNLALGFSQVSAVSTTDEKKKNASPALVSHDISSIRPSNSLKLQHFDTKTGPDVESMSSHIFFSQSLHINPSDKVFVTYYLIY